MHTSEKYSTCLLQIRNSSDIENKNIPYFIRASALKYPIQGIKALDFNDWTIEAELVKNKEDLTKQGLGKIIEIAAGVNLNRKW